jgi:hypothetical protein
MPLLKKTREMVIRSANDPINKARILAAGVKNSGIWLHAIPSSNLGTLLDNDSFRIAMALRLGNEICASHKCRCGQDMDNFGRHALKCKKSAGRFSRHGAVNDIIKRALVSGNVPCIREPLGCSRSDGKRPDGMTLVPWEKGRSMIWDFTCTDTFAPSYISKTSIIPGSAATLREDDKTRKYGNLLDSFVFIPVAIETTGVVGPKGLKFLQDVGRRLRETTGEPRSTFFLLQKISLAVQRGNAASILGATPKQQGLEEVFYILSDRLAFREPKGPTVGVGECVSGESTQFFHLLSSGSFSS